LGNNYPDLSSIFIFNLFRIPDLVVETFRCFNVSFVPFPMFWKKKNYNFPMVKIIFSRSERPQALPVERFTFILEDRSGSWRAKSWWKHGF
jgi:hypothetical protein